MERVYMGTPADGFLRRIRKSPREYSKEKEEKKEKKRKRKRKKGKENPPFPPQPSWRDDPFHHAADHP